MNIELIKEKVLKIKNQFENGDIDKGMKMLKDFSDISSEKQLVNQFMMLSAQYKRYEKKETQNLADNDKDLNRCIIAFLKLVDEIEEKIIDDLSEMEKYSYPYFNNFFISKYWTHPRRLKLEDKDQIQKAICLFTFEVLGKKLENVASINVEIASNKEFKDWLSTKRKFIKEELHNSTFLKISNTGTAHKVHLNKNNTLEESNFHARGSDLNEDNENKFIWDGVWELKNGVFNMKVDIYDLYVFANKGNLLHFGVEFMRNKDVLYHEVYQIPYRKKYSNYYRDE